MITKQFLRLILFDIDGTLISTNGVAKECFVAAMAETLGARTTGDAHDFAGKTDPQIFAEMVRALLEALRNEEAATVALLTGNMLQGARIKLTPPGLLEYFSFGAFGNDAYHRHDLPEIAVARAYERTGATFRAKDIVIIGDTPHDIDCGRHLNVRSIGVATGGHSHDKLAQAKPDHLFDDLTDTNRLLDIIFS